MVHSIPNVQVDSIPSLQVGALFKFSEYFQYLDLNYW